MASEVRTSDGCLVCGGTKLERLATLLSPFDPRLWRHAAICHACGHVQISPLPSDRDLERAHIALFGSKYHTAGRDDALGQRTAKVLAALEGSIADGTVICDIGAGEGWLLDALAGRRVRYLAIEPTESLASRITAHGGEVIAATLDDIAPSWHGSADIAVFRHVLEHVKAPRPILSRIHALLRPGGLLYIALPNATQIGGTKGFRTSYLRPVHVSYFHPKHVVLLLRQSGFDVVSESYTGETALVARKRPDAATIDAVPDVFAEQNSRFRASARASLLGDALNAPRIIAGWAKRWIR